MKFNPLFIFIMACLLVFVGCFQTVKSSDVPSVEWIHTYGGPNNEAAYGIIQASDGGYVLAGSTSSFGAGGSDVWLIKTDSTGAIQWNRTYGGSSDDVASVVIQSQDGGYAIIGLTASFGAGGFDYWLIQTDPLGNSLWNITYGGPKDDFGTSIVQTSDGGYILAGWTNSFGSGGEDMWLVRTDSSGNMVWNQAYGGSNNDEAHALIQVASGGFVVAGDTALQSNQEDAWLIETDSTGNMLWNHTFGGSALDTFLSIVQTGQNYVLSGYSASYGQGQNQVWLVKTSLDGSMEWSRTFGESNDEQAYAAIRSKDGGYVVVGQTIHNGTKNYLIIKADPSGNTQWERANQDTQNNFANSVVQANDLGLVLAGVTDTQSGGTDVLIVKLSSEGSGGFSFLLVLIVAAIVAIVIPAIAAIVLINKRRHR